MPFLLHAARPLLAPQSKHSASSTPTGGSPDKLSYIFEWSQPRVSVRDILTRRAYIAVARLADAVRTAQDDVGAGAVSAIRDRAGEGAVGVALRGVSIPRGK